MKVAIQMLIVLVCWAAGCANVPSDGIGGTQENLHRRINITQFNSEANVTVTAPPAVDICHGADGTEYTVTSISGSGPFVSEELGNGTFYVDARLLHGPDGRGISYDDLVVLNEDGTEKLRGRAKAVDPTPGEPTTGLVEFRLADGGFGVTGTQVTLPPPPPAEQTINIVYGRETPNVQQLGFVIDGGCAGFMIGWRFPWEFTRR